MTGIWILLSYNVHFIRCFLNDSTTGLAIANVLKPWRRKLVQLVPKRFKFYDFSSYAKTLPGDAFFVYDNTKNRVAVKLDSIDWCDFFVGKEIM